MATIKNYYRHSTLQKSMEPQLFSMCASDIHSIPQIMHSASVP